MLTDAFLILFVLLLQAVVTALPVASADASSFGTSLTTLFETAYSFNDIFPIDTLLTCLSLVIFVEVALFIFKGSNWLYNKVRGA